MSKHTKGPWEFRDMRKWNGASSFYIVAPNASDKRSPNVALIPNSTMHDTGANARLIAAAPELLEALKLAEKVLLKDTSSKGKADYSVIRNAIEKATGASQ